MKNLSRILFFCFFIFSPFIVLAHIDPFSYTTTGQIPSVTATGESYSIIYTITSQLPLKGSIDVSFKKPSEAFTIINNCKSVVLPPKGSCTVKVIFQTKQLGSHSDTLLAKIEKFNIINTTLSTMTKNRGHFTFEQADKPITALNLSPNAQGIVVLKNTGDMPITDLSVANLTQTGFKNVDCPTASGTLAPNASCSFSYNIAATPAAAHFAITATGEEVDNTPDNLPVDVDSAGHFVFEQASKPITALNLGPNARGTVVVKNTGGTAITDLSVANLTQMGFKNVDCPTASGTLAPNASCSFNYNIAATPAAAHFAITATGEGVDNTPDNLPVDVDSAGHFVFEQAGKPITALNLGPKAWGIVILKNTGGTAITDLSVANLTQAGFKNVDCPTASGTLAPNASCSFIYRIAATPVAAHFAITATGKGVDNTPDNLSVDVDSAGHFVFEQASKPITALNLGPNAQGTVVLKNTGGTTITDLSVANLTQAGFKNVDCPTASGTLAPNASCSFSYDIAATPAAASFTIVANGQGASNTPDNLPVRISPEYLYMTTQGNTQICMVDGKDGSLKNCHNTGSNFLGADYAIFDRSSKRAYISDFAGSDSHPQNVYTLCKVSDTNGDLTDCKMLPISSAAIYTQLIYFNKKDPGIYVYSYNTDLLYYCPVDVSTGVLSNYGCTPAIKKPNNPTSIAFDVAHSRAYIAQNSNSIIACKLDPNTGKLTNDCVSAINKNVNVIILRLNNNHTGIYYLEEGAKAITYCKIDAKKDTLTNCESVGGDVSGEPLDFALNTSNTGMYIAKRSLTYCNVDPDTGKLSHCKELLDSASNITTVHARNV